MEKTLLAFSLISFLYAGTETYARFNHDQSAILLLLQALALPSTLIDPPKGTVLATEYAKRHEGSYVKLMDLSQISIPSFPLKENRQPFELITFPEVFVLKIPKGRVFGKDGVMITDEDLVLGDTAESFLPAEQHSIFKQWCLPPVVKSDERIAVIASPGGDSNYFHWMFDVLPRLEILKNRA